MQEQVFEVVRGAIEELNEELDYDSLRRARYLLPTLRDSNLALIRRELARWEEILGVPPESREV